jgi:hypothetical protein
LFANAIFKRKETISYNEVITFFFQLAVTVTVVTDLSDNKAKTDVDEGQN